MGKRIGALVMAAVVALSGCAPQKSAAEEPLSADGLAVLLRERPAGLVLVDVRTPAEYAAGHIPGAINIPVDEITDRPPADDRRARVIVYCRTGNRSNAAREALLEMGFTDVTDFGGISRWRGRLVTGADPGTFSE